MNAANRSDEVTIRPVHHFEWREVRALRLQALHDEAASIAFLDSIETAEAHPDEFWQQRAAAASLEARTMSSVRQFVAITSAGAWVGSVTVLLERAGDEDFEGVVIQRSAGGIVGVYLDPAYRGRGILQRLFDNAFEWIRERGLGYARLYVHSDNLRAQRAYANAGFLPTGTTLVGSLGSELEMAREV